MQRGSGRRRRGEEIELPRVKLDLVEEGPKKQWLKILKESASMENIPEDFDPVMKKALSLLDLRAWRGEIMKKYEFEKFNRDDYSIVFQEQFDKGREEGITQGISQGLEKGAFEKARDIALRLLNMGRPLNEIVACTDLSQDDIRKLQHNHDGK